MSKSPAPPPPPTPPPPGNTPDPKRPSFPPPTPQQQLSRAQTARAARLLANKPPPLNPAALKQTPATPPPPPPPVEAKPPVEVTPAQPAPEAQIPAGQNRFSKTLVRPTLHPRRVVGGYRLNNRPPALTAGDAAEPEAASTWTWAAQRWMRIVEQRAPGEQLAEGLEYARAGQTRSIDIRQGHISARVQGRMPQAYKTAVRLPIFTPDQWDKVLGLMSSQAKYGAALLSGELPTNIEDMFAPAGLALFPADASDLSCSCECDVFTGRTPDYVGAPPVNPVPAPPAPKSKSKSAPTGVQFCKHVCCLMYLVADKLASSPLSIFMLRGLPEQDLLERLRQARALQGLQRTGAASPVYTPHVAGVVPAPSLEELAADFWSPADPDALDGLDMPIAKPDVSHPLLRRVGPSPFQGAKFPITGLLATCYDVISESVIRESEGEPGSGQSSGSGQ